MSNALLNEVEEVNNIPISQLPFVIGPDSPLPPAPKKPVSEKQLDANRRNAQKSTGPKTDEGKSRTRLNAMRHGLTGQTTVMTGAQREAHDLFHAGLVAYLKPVGPLEEVLLERIAESHWRLKRSGAMEENLYALGHPDVTCLAELSYETPGEADPELAIAFAHARSFMAHPTDLQLLTLYEQRIHRTIDRNLQSLRELQAERKGAQAEALEEALLLAQLAEAEGEDYNPAEDTALTQNGFVFSTSEIKTVLHRKRRLERARQLFPPTVKRPKAPRTAPGTQPLAPECAL